MDVVPSNYDPNPAPVLEQFIHNRWFHKPSSREFSIREHVTFALTASHGGSRAVTCPQKSGCQDFHVKLDHGIGVTS